MINSPTNTYYMIRASGEAAELITSVFSPGTMGDITDVVVRSREFTNDIEPINESDEAVRVIKSGLGTVMVEQSLFNPLYIPMKLEELDEALDVEHKSEHVRFTGMNGNPFAVKITEIEGPENEPILSSIVSYNQFDLPSYDVIMAKQTSGLLN